MSDSILPLDQGQSANLPQSTVRTDPFGFLFEKSADGILIVDQAGKVCLSNPAAEVFFAKKAIDLVGMPLKSLGIEDTKTEIELSTFS